MVTISVTSKITDYFMIIFFFIMDAYIERGWGLGEENQGPVQKLVSGLLVTGEGG